MIEDGIPISDFCQTGSGITPSRQKAARYFGGTIPWVKSGELRESEIISTGELVTDEAINETSLKLIPSGSLLIAMYGATVGRVGLLGIPATTNQAVCHIIPDPKKADTRYMFHALQHKSSELVRRGVGGAQPNISQAIVRGTRIFLPSLNKQRRIAAILDKADAIRRKREQALALADDFLRSLFLDMFGDPVTNPKKFPVGTIRDLVSEVRYGTSQKASLDEGELPILRMGNITYEGDWKLNDLKYIDIPDKDRDKYTVHKDDILFNRTNSKELVGKTAVFDRENEFAFAGYLVRARVNNLADPYYISAYMNSNHGKFTLQSMCKSIVGMANINAQEFQNIKICIPPIDLQRDYRRFVDSVAQKKVTLDNAMSDAKILFASLSQRAFRGEL